MSTRDLVDALEVADRYVRDLIRQVAERNAMLRRCERHIASLEQQLLVAERSRRDAEERTAVLERELAEKVEVITELAARNGDLEADKQSLSDEFELLRNGSDDREEPAACFDELDEEEQEAIRYRIRCEQALRARLAKKDMSARARLRTLREAKRAGMLTRRLRAELLELQDELG